MSAPKKVLLVTEFNQPSGYYNIAVGLAEGLAKLGADVTIIGMNWNGAEHNYPFRIVPSLREYITAHTVTLAKEFKSDWVLVMMDVPKIVSMFNNILTHHPTFNRDFNCAALFPVESWPISTPAWVAGLSKFRTRFTFTGFGVRQCTEDGLPAHLLPVGLDPFWYREPEEFSMFDWTEPYVLMVAKNQLRKNQWGAMRMMKEYGRRLVLVTDPDGVDGWDLRHLAKQADLKDGQLVTLDLNLVSRDQLKMLYRKAESLLLPSLAEGIGFPLYEAQACGCPVVATNCCGIPEAVTTGRLIDVEYVTPYPWGNTYHHWPSVEQGVRCLREVAGLPRAPVIYQTWQPAAEKLATVLELITKMGGAL